MDPTREERLRLEVAERLSATGRPPPTTRLGRGSRALLGAARASALPLRNVVRRLSRQSGPDVDAVSALARSLGELKGPVMKLGQLLGYIDLFGVSPDVRTGLAALQTQAQPMPFSQVRQIVERELGEAGRPLLEAMEPTPIAAASIGQVHRSRLTDGTKVAVKVGYPGIREAVTRDFAPAALGGRLLSWILPRANLAEFVDAVRSRILEECDFAVEAARQERFGDLFRDHPTIVIPAVHRAFCSSHVLTTTFIEGKHLGAFLASDPTEESRQRAGLALFELYLGTLFKHGLYDCDPHPGNYLFLPDGRVAFLDFGCVREFATGFVGQLARLTRAVRADDGEQIHAALLELGIARPGVAYDRPAMRWLLRAFYGPMLRDEVAPLATEANLREVLRHRQPARGLGLPGEVMFLLRTWLGLSAVLGRLGVRANAYRLLDELLRAHEEPVPGPRPSEATPRPGTFEVVLLDAGASVIDLVREIRDATGLGLADVKEVVFYPPRAVKRGLPLSEAEALRERLEATGAKIDIRPV